MSAFMQPAGGRLMAIETPWAAPRSGHAKDPLRPPESHHTAARDALALRGCHRGSATGRLQ